MPTQLATLACSALPEQIHVVAFQGTEALCRPYRFEIFFTDVQNEDFSLADAIGAKATLSMQRDGDPFVFHGILASLELRGQTKSHSVYRAVLVPQLWQLSLSFHSNAFTEKSIVEIIESVLDEGGFGPDEYEIRVDADYQPEELVCQYKESWLDFLHRWMEHVGLYYFFEQGDDAEKLIITDHLSFHKKLSDKTVRFLPIFDSPGLRPPAIETFTVHHSATAEAVRLTDYDYAKPSLEVAGKSTINDAGFGEVAIYGARFFTPEQGKRFADVRAEELRAKQVVYYASGSDLHMSAGYLFEMEDHPRDSLNAEYFVTEVRHFCNQHAGTDDALRKFVKAEYDEIYRFELAAIGKDVQYRKPRETAWPRIWGHENGVVDGSAESEYAQIDDQGRYKVKIMFDESDLKKGKASTYVRMMQPHGGKTEGFHFPLRKGTEVLFSFLAGDPDRPVIAGVAPNAHTPSPITSSNHTRNMIRTGAGNHITIEDNAGKEFIHLSTPKFTEVFMGGPTEGDDEETQRYEFGQPPEGKATNSSHTKPSFTYYMYTDKNAGFRADGQWWQSVGGDINIYGNGKLLEQYAGPQVFNISGDASHFYGSKLNVEVDGGRDLKITSGDTVLVKGGQTYTVEGDQTYKVSSNQTFTITGHGAWDHGTMMWVGGGTNFSFGNTSLTFKQTTLDWGDTTGTVASFKIDAPGGWEVKSPQDLWAFADFEFQGSKKSEFTGFAMGATSLKVEYTAAKLDFHTYHLQNEGIALYVSGAKKEDRGADSENKGAEAGSGGIVAWLKANITFV